MSTLLVKNAALIATMDAQGRELTDSAFFAAMASSSKLDQQASCHVPLMKCWICGITSSSLA